VFSGESPSEDSPDHCEGMLITETSRPDFIPSKELNMLPLSLFGRFTHLALSAHNTASHANLRRHMQLSNYISSSL
jgi:hypothetical protein